MSDIMRQKALRLPLMLVGLIIMAWVIQTFRPHITANQAPTKPYRDAAQVEMVTTTQAATATTTDTLQQTPLSLQKPATWRLQDISAIQKQGNITTLHFTDGSTRQVSPALFSQLSGELQTRVNYERD